MDSEFEQVPFGGQPFVDNPEPRCPCLLLADNSYSLRGEGIKLLNSGIADLSTSLKADPLASKRVEIAVVSFGPVTVRQHFETADEFVPPRLEAEGDTPMGEAILRGIEMVEARKELYRQNGISYYRPWIFLVTDGKPTDGDAWKQAAKRVREGEASKAFAFFGVGVRGADMAVLDAMSERGGLPLDGLRFRELFAWLSSSLKSVSHSRVGEAVSLAKPGWTSV